MSELDAGAGDVFSSVVGQPVLVRNLRSAVASPVHAYLLVGPSGAGAKAAAHALAAALLCAEGGCGACRACRLALAGQHPDANLREPSGAFVSIDDARAIIHEASLSTVEGGRRVYTLTEMHRVRDAGPALLKIVEEPPEGVVFVLLADHVPDELVPVASRCLRLDVAPLDDATIESILSAEGAAPEIAAAAASASFGDLERARLLVTDDKMAERRRAWELVPARLDGTGAAVAVIVDELMSLIEAAADALLTAHKAELAKLQERAELTGERLSGMRRELEARHRRELRRHKAMELRFGLSVLGGAYRPLLAAPDPGPAVAAVAAIAEAGDRISHNAREELLLQSLLLRLPPMRREGPGAGLVASSAAPE